MENSSRTKKRGTSKERKGVSNSSRSDPNAKYLPAMKERSRKRIEDKQREKEAKDKKKREEEHKRMRDEQEAAEWDILQKSNAEYLADAAEFMSQEQIDALIESPIVTPEEAKAKVQNLKRSNLWNVKQKDSNLSPTTVTNEQDEYTLDEKQDELPVTPSPVTQPSQSQEQTPDKNRPHFDSIINGNSQTDVSDEKAFHRDMLKAFIENGQKMAESTDEDDDDSSFKSTDSVSSEDTVTHTNKRKSTRNKKKRDINQGLDGYTTTPSKHISYCKAKVAVPESDSPTKKMREALGKILVTLLKIDTSLKLYEYMDKTNRKFINNPSQIPETPSKIKTFFHGRYRPDAKAKTLDILRRRFWNVFCKRRMRGVQEGPTGRRNRRHWIPFILHIPTRQTTS